MTAARSVTASFVRYCLVPRLKGKSLKAARRALKAHDCAAGKIKRAFSSSVRKGRVISQKPKPRRRLKHGAKVRLTVSKGRKP
jgi:serine/threonine-protein kinase